MSLLVGLRGLKLGPATGLVAWGRRGWGQRLRWGTIVTALLLASFNLMPLGIQTGEGLGWSHSPHLQEEWPHPQMVDSILSAEPYLEATVGVLSLQRVVDTDAKGVFEISLPEGKHKLEAFSIGMNSDSISLHNL